MRFLIAITLILSSVLSSTALAGKANDVTYPNQGICDQHSFTTPGLYGLCVAYCEAQAYPTDPNEYLKPDLMPNPATKILGRYNSKKSDDDPHMPCLVAESTCPVFTAEELQNIGVTEGRVFASTDVEQYSHNLITGEPYLFYLQAVTQGKTATLFYAYAGKETGLKRAIYNFFTGEEGEIYPSVVRRADLTEEEAIACFTMLGANQGAVLTNGTTSLVEGHGGYSLTEMPRVFFEMSSDQLRLFAEPNSKL